MEFHISRQSRDRYSFDQTIFAFSGNAILPNFSAARAFAQKMNQQRDLINHPEQAVRPGEINAMGLIDEILHAVVEAYRRERNPRAFTGAVRWLNERIGAEEVERSLLRFAAEFPPVAVYRGEITLAQYYAGQTEGRPNAEVLLEELLMLWLENKNPAFSPYQELFDDSRLALESAYPQILPELYRFFETQPRFGPENLHLIDLLRAPALAFPHSLFDQLDFIRARWSEVLGTYLTGMLNRLLSSIDLIREENIQRGFGGPGPVPVPTYDAAQRDLEIEAFSPDTEWMPRLVLIAKNVYVWMDQLSQAYSYKINRLDQIPDAELERLARWGITGLWLIGLWERSRASARIKQMMGNPEALASAYSLYDYRIADDLGGEEAYRGLRDKAWRFGVRLASDMVPNHMGIDSPWVIDHPEWFLSLDYSPYPSYSFNSPDLSADGRATIQIEDHYFDKTDAAVVFRHIDHRNGHTRFIYHGNDGTTMPWNDTAQLNYLVPEVREAVIQTILAVARRFPIIRFDAAMTLAKLHFQRLWFPTPGTGGAIPSRSEYGMSKEQFDHLMPVEFWREVVDRVAVEAPDTLLLAEAFWLMESYFVRTLGMHRVYNSAFMNILRNEENAKYRLIMKNTLEFDPEILKRYVNFMNNPDERTAVDQFGKGDKYFGVCMLMSTMPGLPMFGHGQIEGYSEKYGMEFKRAYWDEKPDPWLVERHQREIFPVLHRRALFAGVENFLLYDFFTESGGVNEDVFAYSNGLGGERALVIYHNRFGNTQGWVRVSVSYSVKGPGGDRFIIQRTLGEGLNLHADPQNYVIFRDVVSGLEYIRPSLEIIEQGLFLALHAYQYHCYLDFEEVADDSSGSFRQIHAMLGGRGVPSIRGSLQELMLQPVLQPLREMINPGYLRYLYEAMLVEDAAALPDGLITEAREKLARLLDGIERMEGAAQNRERLAQDMEAQLRMALSLAVLEDRYPLPGSRKYSEAAAYLRRGPKPAVASDEEDGSALMDERAPGQRMAGAGPAGVEKSAAEAAPELAEVQPVAEQELPVDAAPAVSAVDAETAFLLFSYIFLHGLGRLSGQRDDEAVTLHWLDEWLVWRVVQEAAQGFGLHEAQASEAVQTLKLVIEQQRWFEKRGKKRPEVLLEGWLANLDVQDYLQVNRYQDVLWFNQQRFDAFVWWMVMAASLEAVTGPRSSAALLVERLLLAEKLAQKLLQAQAQSEYQIAKLLRALR